MKIIESLFIEQNDDMFAGLSEVLPLAPLPDSKLPAFRLEIDPELVLIFYKIDTDTNLYPEILENIFPHLERIVLLTSAEDIDNFKIPAFVLQKMEEYSGSFTAVVVISLNDDSRRGLKEPYVDKGLFLGEGSHLFFWNPQQRDDSLRIWKKMWEKFI